MVVIPGLTGNLLQFVLDVGDDLAVKQVNRTLGAGGVLLAVGYHHDGRAFLVQFLQQVHHLLAVLGVEVTGGLVREDQLRAGHDGTGDGHTLLLTGGG